MSENYSFQASYIVNHESLLLGKEAQIIVRPILKVNDRKCSLKTLKNTKITLATQSFIEELVTTKVFDNLHPTSDEEIILTFQVPPNIQKIAIIVQTEVMNISKGNTENLTSTHEIELDTHSGENKFYDGYLRKMKDIYYYYLLGKNGEPLVDSPVSFTFSHMIYFNKMHSTSFNTDHEGKIRLGPLKNISTVSPTFNGPNGTISDTYQISTFTESVSLPSSLNIVEDEEIVLPFISNYEFSEDSVCLIRYSRSDATIEN